MRMRRHLRLAEAAHLAADRLQRLVEAGIADAGEPWFWLNSSTSRARFSGVLPSAISVRAASVLGCGNGFLREAERRQPDDLALAHRDAAEDLRGVFAGADPDRVILDGAVAVLGLQPLAIGLQLAQRHDIGGEPGEAVGGMLLGLEPRRRNLAVDQHHLADAGSGLLQQGLETWKACVDQADGRGRGGLMQGCLRAHGLSLPIAMQHRARSGECEIPLSTGDSRSRPGAGAHYLRLASTTPTIVTAIPTSCSGVIVSPNRNQASTATSAGTR